ncbi:MAG: DUF1957 domain-containing protein [Deltaproteobacteria bacterium]|nr:DUF1957 domain-containing protein [Deltaproteobacteria bacterium]
MASEPAGTLSLVLHAHLPFVRHPEYSDFLEEDWLFEAITETYVPLLRALDRLWKDGIDFRLAISLTPPLCEMLADPLLQERTLRRLHALVDLAGRQARERRGTPFEAAATYYAWDLEETRHLYEEVLHGRILDRFREYQERGCIEILTCAATHGFLPLMATDEARHAQVAIGARNYEKHFGRRPQGIWLPECAYAPGLDHLLAREGIRWFCVESHGLQRGTPNPRYGTARPVCTPSGVAAFGRDRETSEQVWSAESGYPGDPLYREFYRDLGYDLPYDEVRSLLHGDGVRRSIGLKFHRITGKVPLDRKEPWVPAWALERADVHAGNFLHNRQAQVRHLSDVLEFPPHLTAPYDAELFGHWWFEGPRFLESFLRKAACDQRELELLTPSEYLARHPVHEEVTPALSSWGARGFFEVWLNEKNDWIYRHLHRAEERMVDLVQRFPKADGVLGRALRQAGRELLLAQASDWAFIMTMGTSVPYAEKRTRDHLSRFTGLYEQILGNRLEEPWLEDLEWRDSIFQELDPQAWNPAHVRIPGLGTAVGSTRVVPDETGPGPA